MLCTCHSFIVTLFPCSSVWFLLLNTVCNECIQFELTAGCSSSRTDSKWVSTIQKQTAPVWISHGLNAAHSRKLDPEWGLHGLWPSRGIWPHEMCRQNCTSHVHLKCYNEPGTTETTGEGNKETRGKSLRGIKELSCKKTRRWAAQLNELQVAIPIHAAWEINRRWKPACY